HAAFVADRLGVDVFVTDRVADDSMSMHAALVGKRTGADKGLIGAKVHVGNLVHIARHFGQAREAAGRQHFVAAFEDEVSDNRHEVGIAAALADAVDCALHLGGSAGHGGKTVG